MSKHDRRSNNAVNQIFDDLESYLNFCRSYGYKFNQSELYSNRSYTYRQYQKYLAGKPFKDMWEVDGKTAS